MRAASLRAIVVAGGLVALVAAQDAAYLPIALDTNGRDGLFQCEMVTITWEGGVPPFNVSEVRPMGATQVIPPSWDTAGGGLGLNLESRSTTWLVRKRSGETVSLMVVDSSNPRLTGSKLANVQSSNDTRCLVSPSSGTSSSTSMPPPPQTPSVTPVPDNQGHSTNTAAIAGGVVGGVVGAALIAVVIIQFLRRRKRRTQRSEAGDIDEKFDITHGESHGDHRPPLMTPYHERSALSQDTPLTVTSNTTSTQDSASQKYHSPSVASNLPTTELVSRKYQDLQSAHSPTATSPTTSLPRGMEHPGLGKNIPPISPTASRPLPHPSSNRAVDDLVVEEELDAGPVPVHETVPPRYNPEWERERRQ